jgi:hypothetical protein
VVVIRRALRAQSVIPNAIGGGIYFIFLRYTELNNELKQMINLFQKVEKRKYKKI